MRLRTTIALAAVLGVTLLADGAARAGGTSLPDSTVEVWVLWAAMTVTIVLGVAVAYLVMCVAPPDFATAALCTVVGAAVAYSWPVAFQLGVAVPDFLTRWTTGPALLVWQGLLIFAVGLAGLVRRALAGSGPGSPPEA
jgi:hypothetical protein